jgi:hypothetical protein
MGSWVLGHRVESSLILAGGVILLAASHRLRQNRAAASRWAHRVLEPRYSLDFCEAMVRVFSTLVLLIGSGWALFGAASLLLK